MDKVQRFIVHDAVEQWSQQTSVAIVSESMGDDDERHVEVYR